MIWQYLRNIDFWLGVKNRFLRLCTPLIFWISLLNVGVILYRVGFTIDAHYSHFLHSFFMASAIILLVLLLLRALLRMFNSEIAFWRRATEFIPPLLLGAVLAGRGLYLAAPEAAGPILIWLVSDGVFNLLFIAFFLIEASKSSFGLLDTSLHPALLFVLSFLIIILLGTGLLLLPNATVGEISFIDALFTSTSAVCVTGLIVLDTAKDFTFLGQTFILILLQIGGLGIMTFTSFFGFFFKGNTSFQSQMFFKDFVNESQIGAIFKTLIRIVVFTLSLELLGAGVIYILAPAEQFSNLGEQVWFSIFHSISAFCNAGFSTLSQSLYEPGFRTAYNLHLVIGGLIVIGGLGFPIIFNYARLLKSMLLRLIRQFRSNIPYIHIPRIININTKIVINTTVILILSGMVFFAIAEYSNILAQKSWYGKVVTAFFASVTPRTAGFNTIDMSQLAMPTILIYLLLMWIGASPASTGGGIKTSTVAVALLNTLSLAKAKNRVEVFRREIDNESIRRAFSIILLSFVFIGFAIFLVATFEPQMRLIDIIFECFSAFGTVGLSLGITSSLSAASKGVIIASMFIGRVGTLTLIVALTRKIHTLSYRYPRESIFIN